MKSGKQVVIIGCGPGGPGYLTGMALQAAENAEVLIGTAKLLALFPETGIRIELKRIETEKIVQLIAGLDCDKAAVLVSGDTGFYSLASSLRRLAPAQWEVSYVPGISSIQAACALFALEWQEMRFFSLHYQAAPPELAETAARGEQHLAILCGPGNEPGRIAGDLLAAVEPDRVCYVACDIGSEEQVTWSGTLCELAGLNLSGHSVLIIGRIR